MARCPRTVYKKAVVAYLQLYPGNKLETLDRSTTNLVHNNRWFRPTFESGISRIKERCRYTKLVIIEDAVKYS